MSWKAVYVKSRCEKKAKEMLDASNVNTFLPLQTTVKLRKDRKVKVQEPILRGYVFVKNIDFKQKEMVLNNPFTVGFVKNLNHDAEIKDSEIEILKEIAEKGYFVEILEKSSLEIGNLVTLVSGPFKNKKGKILRVKKEKATLLLFLDGVNQCIKVKVPLGMLIRE
jgi:transcription antitermination factor NusG